jgi:hypothetical protein
MNTVTKIEGQEAREGYALRDQVAALVGGRPFVLVVKGESAEIFAAKLDAGDLASLLEEVAANTRAVRPEQGKPIELTNLGALDAIRLRLLKRLAGALGRPPVFDADGELGLAFMEGLACGEELSRIMRGRRVEKKRAIEISFEVEIAALERRLREGATP